MPVYERSDFETKDALANHWLFDCPSKGCFYIVSAPSKNAAEICQVKHVCAPPLGKGGKMSEIEYTPVNGGKSILETLWDELDKTVDKILEGPRQHSSFASESVDLEHEGLKARASGLAFAISLMSRPWYPTERDVSKEASRRHQMRKGVIDFDATPGYKYNPPPPGSELSQLPRSSSRTALVESAGKPLAVTLPAESIAAIRHAHKTVGFTADQLAKAYKVSVPVINQILSETGA